MDVIKAINSVRNLNSFISLTHDLTNKHELSQIPLNMSTTLALRQIRSFEFEFFSKRQESGLAFMILEHLLKLPPSKTWCLLGKELMPILLYWLEGLRKYLMNHCQHWWIFLKSLLKFINELRQKDPTLNTALVEYLADPLFGLATSDKLDLSQRLAVLRCLNHCSGACSRETRQALAEKLDGYFTKIAHIAASCEHVPTQMASTELMLRWLLRRHERSAREAAAHRWLPVALWEPAAIALFIQSTFRDFYKDARDFLNAQNETSENVTSVICRKMAIGSLTIITGTEPFPTWLDVHTLHGSVTVQVEPRRLPALDVPSQPGCDTLTLAAHTVTEVELCRESAELIISMQTSQPPEALFEATAAALAGRCGARLHVSSRCDVARLDRALRLAFRGKYRCLLDVDKAAEVTSSSPREYPPNYKRFSASEDDTRFSDSYDILKTGAKKRKRSGYVVKTRRVSGWKSPSTTSTTSLAQLHEKLASLPRLRYDKEPLGVCAPPELSLVAELSEPDDSVVVQRRPRAYGVSQRCRVKARTSPSDNEDASQSRCIAGSDHETSISCLHVATFGSIDDSVINDSSEKNKGHDIVDLLAREALGKEATVATPVGDGDSGINTAEDAKINGGENNSAVKSVVVAGQNKLTASSKASKCTVVSKSTSDESNTEPIVAETGIKPYVPASRLQKRVETSDDSNTDAISETPRNYVSVRRRNLRNKSADGNLNAEVADKVAAFDIDDIEEFFSQHYRETKDGNLIISPTLARKINESTSETSESFDQYLISNLIEDDKLVNEFDVDPTDIVDCLSNIIDTVCAQIDKCTVYLQNQDTAIETLQEEVILPKNDKRPQQKQLKGARRTPKIKLTYKGTVPKKDTKKLVTKKGKLQMESIVEQNPEVVEEVTVIEDCNKENVLQKKKSDSVTPLLQRRKRKLYSPKDMPIHTDVENNTVNTRLTDDDDIVPLVELKTKSNLNTPKVEGPRKTTPKSAATSYKDIENERQRNTKPIRNRKSKVTTPILSPKTEKNNSIFDKLKDNLDNKDLKIVDNKSSGLDIAVYNFTSESEDEDFVKKKFVDARKSATTLCSNDSVSTKGRVLSKVNYTERSADEAKGNNKLSKKGSKRQPVKRKGKKANEIKKQKYLVDERMRDANTKELNTSFTIEQTTEKTIQKDVDVEPVKNSAQEMELMEEVILEDQITEEQSKINENEYDEQEVMKAAGNQRKTDTTENRTCKKGDTDVPTKKTTKRNNDLSLKKIKDTKRNYTKLTEEHSDESLLPALIIEKTVPRPDDDIRSTTSSNLIKKCNKLIEEGDEFFNDTVATQNMLSDVDKINYSPELEDYPVELELCNKLNVPKHKKTQEDKKKPKSAVVDTTELTTKDAMPDPTETNVRKPKKDKHKPKIAVLKTTDLSNIDNGADVFQTNVVAKLKTHKKKLNTSVVETIDITEGNDASDKSLATNDTSRLFYDSDKCPPKPSELSKKIEPRNMELEQLSPSMHDYFLQLRTEITEAPEKKPVKQKRSDVAENIDDARSSPVVCLKRLNDEDFRKWLPSPKSSFTADPPEEVTELPKNYSKEKPHNSNAKRNINLDDSDSESSKTVQENKLTKLGKRQLREVKIEKMEVNDVVKAKAGAKDDAHVNSNKKNNPKGKEAKPEGEPKRFSGISPIRINDGDAGEKDEEDIFAPVQEKPNYLKRITEIFSQTKTKITTKKYNVRSDSNSSDDVYEMVKESSKTSKESFPIPQSRKRCRSPEASSPKWRKVDNSGQTEAVSVSATGGSVSSVKEWFTREQPAKSTADDVHFACRDCIENVLEKLDTTLIEIHQNTSRKLMNMFVEIQAQQNELEARRAELFAASARRALAQTVQFVNGLMEKQYEELDDSYKQMDAEFKEKTRKMAADLVREDCRQKRAMVTILHEDVQAAMDHLRRRRTH